MKILKILGLVLLIMLATTGGALLRLVEVIHTDDPMSLFSSRDVGEEGAQKLDIAAPRFDPLMGTVNVLIVGLDNVGGGRRADVIALAIFDEENKSIRVASLPRDSRVQIPGRGWDKINHSYVYGGISLLKETVVNLTGMPVNYFVIVNYDSFPRIIDLLGGVDIYVEKRLRYTDYSGKLFINIPKGQQHLDGKTALEYVRFRHDPLGDIGRIQRQQKFIEHVMDKLKSPSILPQIPALINEVVEAVNTDLTALETLRLIQFANSLPTERIRLFLAPGKAGYSGNLSYWILDTIALSLELAAKIPLRSADIDGLEIEGLEMGSVPVLSEDQGQKEALTISPEELQSLREQIGKIGLLNGDGESGLVKRASLVFQRLGVEVSHTGNAKHYDYHTTNVVYPKDTEENKAAARALARLCGIVNPGLIRVNRDVSIVSVILGHDKEKIFANLEALKF
ncbi:MAG: LCP family protein [Fretibacterium sp.]|nr:LCP family protein [Fretibacterium sp.]